MINGRLFTGVGTKNKLKFFNALTDEFELFLGGLKSKGFGRCKLKKVGTIDGTDVGRGILNVRIPLDETHSFNIKNIIKPVYGYLFKKDPGILTGDYVLSLFEGSEVAAPRFLLRG